MPHAAEVNDFLRRVLRLADVLLAKHFDGAADLRRLQPDLQALQREVQASIGENKRLVRQDPERRELLGDLRVVRWHARRLGDAFAWIVLGLDRAAIHSLGDNSRVAVAGTTDHGEVGLLAIAQHLAGEGWGFPLLHDVTDCLRIGDVTFVKPAERGTRQLRTLEVKTRLLGEPTVEDGGLRQQLQVHLISPEPLGPPQTDAVASPDATGPAGPRSPTVAGIPAPQRDRVSRQLERMTKALAKQAAKDDGVPVEIPGEAPLMSVGVDTDSGTHWKTLRKLIRDARREGYAVESVDGTFVYVAYYRAGGVGPEDTQDVRLPRDLADAGVLIPGDERNAVVLLGIVSEEGPGAGRHLPFWLYDIPRRAVKDLLHGRLAVVVLVNPAGIYRALETTGFSVRSRPGVHPLGPDAFVVHARAEDDERHQVELALHGLAWHVSEVVEEFKSVHYIVEVAEAMRDAAVNNWRAGGQRHPGP